MTEQDAIELLKRRKVLSWQGGFGDYDEAEQMAIKALEKQIPKKPFKTMDENNPYYKYMPWCCPCCRETLYEDTEWGNQEFAYCTDCGQKLNWERGAKMTDKIRERLQELCEQTYYNSVNGNRDEGIRNNAYHNAINIINQVEAEYTCENCAEKGKCAICDNFNIKFCSDCRPIIAPPYTPKGE